MQTEKTLAQNIRIGELLVEAELLGADKLPEGLKEAQLRSVRLGEVFVMLRYLSAEDLDNVLEAQTRINEGEVRCQQAVAALKHACLNKLSFDEGLTYVKKQEDDKRTQLELELAILMARLEDIERTRGPAAKDLAITCRDIADRHAEFGNTQQAIAFYRRALPIFERAFGQRHLKVAGCQSKLGKILLQEGEYKEAETFFWRVLDITQSAWGQSHVQVADCHHCLARALDGQYRLREAEQFYISALRITEEVSGADSPEATDLIRHLALFWRKQGKKPEHRRLGDLLVDSGLLNQEQLEAALSYCKEHACPLGHALVKMQNIEQDALRPALQAQILIGDGVLPSQIASRALRMERHGKEFSEALKELGWEPDALTTEELTVLIQAAEELVSAEAALGPEHAGVAVLSMKLADLYTGQMRFEQAEALYVRAKNILHKVFGAKDAEVATALVKLANLYLLCGRPKDAEPLLSQALALRLTVHGEHHLDVSETMDMLGLAYQQMSNAQEAERLHRTAFKVRKEALGADNPKTVQAQEHLADSLLSQSRCEEAEQLYQELLALHEKKHGLMNVSRALLLEHLGDVYLAKADIKSALLQFELALGIHEKNDNSSLLAAELMEKMSGLLENTGRKEESKKMFERAQMAKRLRI